jgi:peroxiredoxin
MIAIGERLPEVTFKVKTDEGTRDVSTAELFAGRKVVLFAVPGAFTPTCSMNHLPGFLENAEAIKSKGVDTIAVVSVNDHHVMHAWSKATGAGEAILFLADGVGAFTKAVGLDIDMSGGGLGLRSKRYSMIVDDGVVASLEVEPSPGQAVVSGASALLEKL